MHLETPAPSRGATSVVLIPGAPVPGATLIFREGQYGTFAVLLPVPGTVAGLQTAVVEKGRRRAIWYFGVTMYNVFIIKVHIWAPRGSAWKTGCLIS